MNKKTKFLTVIITTSIFSIFSIQLIAENSFQPIFLNSHKENNNKKYFSDLKIIEKIADKKDIKNDIKFVGEEQIPIKPSESSNNKIDDKIAIKNEVKERNTNLKIINADIDKNQSISSKNSLIKQTYT